jgi:hypothetical protein
MAAWKTSRTAHYRRDTEMDELAGFTVTTVRLSDTALEVLDLNAAERLGYLKASDEWTDGQAPLPDALQDTAHRLLEAGWLDEFEE